MTAEIIDFMKATKEDKIIIRVDGPEHSGKTTLRVLMARFLEELGANVVLQNADSQLPEKMEEDTKNLAKRLDGVNVLIMEMQTNG